MSLSNRSAPFTLPPISTLLSNEPMRNNSFKLPPLGSNRSSPISAIADARLSPSPFSQISQIPTYQQSPQQLPPLPIQQTQYQQSAVSQSSLPTPYSRSRSYSPSTKREHLQHSDQHHQSIESPYNDTPFGHDPYTNHILPSQQLPQYPGSPNYVNNTRYVNSNNVTPIQMNVQASHHVNQPYISPNMAIPSPAQAVAWDIRAGSATTNNAVVGTTAPTEIKPNNDSQYAFISHSIKSFPSKEPKIDNIQLARRKRRRTNSKDLEILQREFDLNDNPNKLRRQRIASMVNMNERAVQVWFQNKRQLRKKQRMKAAEQVEMNARE